MKAPLCVCASIFFLFLTTSIAATHEVNIAITGSGTVTRNPQANAYPEGAVVTLTANPAAGWRFAGWSGDLAGTMNPTNLLVDSAKAITATFELLPVYSLSVNAVGSGSANPSSGQFTSNSMVLVTATAQVGWEFDHWEGDPSAQDNPLNVIMNSNRVITAVFVQPPGVANQPLSQTSAPGASVSFVVDAVGTPPLHYEWRFNGQVINGENSATLSLQSITLYDAGNYQVVVSSAYGSATSSVASLTVVCPGTNVVTVADEAALRAAISIGGHVRLCVNGVIPLTSMIVITNDVILDASGVSLAISGENVTRLFRVASGVQFSVTNVALVNGRYAGTNGVDPTMQPNGTWQAATDGESARGAAVYSEGGVVRLVSCVFSNNIVIGGRGGRPSSGYPFGGGGGAGQGAAVYIGSGSCVLSDCTFIANATTNGQPGGDAQGAHGSSAGGAVFGSESSLVVVNSRFTGNTAFARAGDGVRRPAAPASGGAISMEMGDLRLTNVFMTGNSAIGESVLISSIGIVDGAPVQGGAIATTLGSVIVDHSVVSGNIAQGGYSRSGLAGDALGGGLFLNAQARIIASSISTNRAEGGGGQAAAAGIGGGIYNTGQLSIVAVTISSNLARGGNGRTAAGGGFPGGPALGGGVWTAGVSIQMTNVTIVANFARGGDQGAPGVAQGGGSGGGVEFAAGPSSLVNVTIASNLSMTGGGYFPAESGSGANIRAAVAVFLRNSIVAGASNNVSGVITDGGYNMSSDGTANFGSGTSFNFTDPKLLPLANNGGPTFTMALSANSPALDWAPTEGAPSYDQRYVRRPLGSGVDLGAFELGEAGPMLTISKTADSGQLAFPTQAGATYSIQRCSSIPGTWQLVETVGPMPSAIVISRDFVLNGQSGFFRVVVSP